VELGGIFYSNSRTADLGVTAMSRRRRNIWIEAVLWVIAEMILSSAGMDTIADYSEFLVNQKLTVSVESIVRIA
jgi:hypothetical protein